MDVIAMASQFSEYRLEMVLALYTIVIGFSFDIFRKEQRTAFQYLVGISTILYLIGRIFSMWIKFNKTPSDYGELLFFLDISIMIFFYRSLAHVNAINEPGACKTEHYQELWIYTGITMLLTIIYRIIYAGVQIYNLPQGLAVIYCLIGWWLAKVVSRKDETGKKIDTVQLLFCIPFFLGAIIYCIFRAHVRNF